MPLIIQTGQRYWHGRRFRIDYALFDESGRQLDVSRMSFVAEPDAATVEAEKARLLAMHEDQRARALNRLNQSLDARFGEAWRNARPVILRWIKNNPTATASQAQSAFLAAFPDTELDPARFFPKLLAAFDPPFANWAEFRDYILANFATLEGV